MHLQALKNEQDKEIKRLEQLLEEEKFAHENKIRAIKTQYLKEKRALEEEAETKIKEMANSANKVVMTHRSVDHVTLNHTHNYMNPGSIRVPPAAHTANTIRQSPTSPGIAAADRHHQQPAAAKEEAGETVQGPPT